MYKDITIADIRIKNVPCIKDSYNQVEVLLSGKVLDNIYQLILENKEVKELEYIK